jgi:hypothetical protein
MKIFAQILPNAFGGWAGLRNGWMGGWVGLRYGWEERV